jgi:hypothetical protein
MALERFERSARLFFARPFVAWAIVVLALVACLWFWLYPPLPGVAVAVLGATAGIVTFADMRGTHKSLVTIAIFALMGIEINDIRKDRVESDKQAHEQREKDQAAFDKIARGIDTAIQNSQDQFNNTMDGFEATLKATNQTIENTRPHAAVHFVGGFGYLNPPIPPALFRAGVSYTFRSNLANDGSDDATIFRALRKIYIGKPDDKAAQDDLASQFELEWSQLKNDPVPTNFIRQDSAYRTDDRIFTEPEIKELTDGYTVYTLRRLEYSDQTGKWISEDCHHLQLHNGAIDIYVSHPCRTFYRNRARVR